MNDPEDLLLEAALREIHRGAGDAPDQAESIAAAWRRGERGSGVDGLALPGPRTERRASPVRRSWIAAAAALAVVAGALFLRARSTPDVAPPEAGTAGPEELAAGAGPVQVDGEREFELELPGGGRVAGQAAMLTVDVGRIQLELGSVSVRASTRQPLLLDTVAGGVIFMPGARADARVDLDVPEETAEWLRTLPWDERARELTAGGARHARWMTFELVEGLAWIVSLDGAGRSAAVRPGERYLVAENGASSGRLDEATLTRGRELLAWMLSAGGQAFDGRPLWVHADELARTAALGAFLDQHPHFWPVVRAALRQAFVTPGDNPVVCARAVRFLVGHPAEPALALARELWLQDPECFRTEHVVVLAERGAPEFEREIRAIVDIGPREELAALVLPAIYLAQHGHAESRRILERFVAQPLPRGADLFATLLAARCLALDGDHEVWTATRAEILTGIERVLKRGWRDQAAQQAAAVEFFDRRWPALDQSQLRTILPEFSAHCRERTGQLGTDGALEALVAELCNRG